MFMQSQTASDNQSRREGTNISKRITDKSIIQALRTTIPKTEEPKEEKPMPKAYLRAMNHHHDRKGIEQTQD